MAGRKVCLWCGVCHLHLRACVSRGIWGVRGAGYGVRIFELAAGT